jgi:ribosomal protein S18 acetylase RimI-like enzyme
VGDGGRGGVVVESCGMEGALQVARVVSGLYAAVFSLPPVEPLDAAFTRETGTRTFAVIDYGVLPAFRGRGVGRLVHDELLGGSGAVRASLAVRPTATDTQAIYRRWGWRRVGHEVMDPPVPSAEFDILVLEQVQASPVG